MRLNKALIGNWECEFAFKVAINSASISGDTNPLKLKSKPLTATLPLPATIPLETG